MSILIRAVCERPVALQVAFCQWSSLRRLSPAVFFYLCVAMQAQQPSKDLSQMSLEDLLNVRVTTVSKKEQKLSETAAAVYVITAEEIERSGVTSVPEALRLAPGVQVSQINSSTWAIAVRGFDSRYSNKLLVLVDGRSVYSPTFSQVFWQVQDLPLEDIERIEVIRGPGATIWGANAVNGVINIITRSARETQGGMVTASAGNYDHAIAGARYGGTIGSDAAFRVSARYLDRGPLLSPGGGSNYDRAGLERIASRLDWSPSPQNPVSVEGDLYQSEAGETAVLPVLDPPGARIASGPVSYAGGSLLLHWTHTLTGGSEIAWQAFYDRSNVQEMGFRADDDTFDLEFQHQVRLGPRQGLVWGLGFRGVRQVTIGNSELSFIPPNQTTKLFSGFGQDQVVLLPKRLWLTIGSKFEHNDYTGAEIEPTFRLLWAVRPTHSFWIAASRAVRTPASFERGGHLAISASPGAGGIPVLLTLFGNPRFKSENIMGFEAGYRTQISKFLSLDLACFYNEYVHLTGTSLQTPFPVDTPSPIHLVLPLVFGNNLRAHAFGSEITLNYLPARFWRLTGSYSWLRLYYEPFAAAVLTPSFSTGASPGQQTQVHSFLSLPHNLQFDTSLYYSGALPAQAVPAYSRLDLHLAWAAGPHLRLSTGLQNLLDPRHLEFDEPPTPTLPGEVPRSIYGKATWHF